MNANNAKRLVYTMGRVGTSSVNKALIDAGYPAFSAHWLQYGIDDGVAEYPAFNQRWIDRIKSGKGKPVSVVIPIREPVARNIAAYFRVLHHKDLSKGGLPLEEFKKLDDHGLHQMLIENYDYTFPDQWFSLEPMDLFDFNPFESEFPHDIGWKIYKSGIHKILIIRLENCNDQLHHALEELIGVKGIHMVHINEYKGGGEHIYGDYGIKRYKEFTKNHSISKEWVKKNYELQMAQHFWSDEERAKLTERWIDGVSRGISS